MTRVNLAAVDALVIGTSAGGINALLTLVSALPSGFRPAVLVVIHLPPHSPSVLPPLLAQRCALPVAEAQDKQPVMPGSIVVAPPNYHVFVEPGRTIALSQAPPVHFSRPSIDLMFESAAIAYGQRLPAVLLTGSNEDGSNGLLAVRRQGGKVWIQAPATAAVPTMPSAGLALAGADEVLSLSQMRERLVR